MATFTNEQFLTATSCDIRSSSFMQCSVRFKGQRDLALIEDFLSAIIVFKDINQISDIDALRGIPFLLEDYAASWWSGVKDSICSFEQAISRIWTTFTPHVPDWRIFVKIFEITQQKTEPTDTFISKKRLLFSQLMLPLAEVIQLNILYGLLNTNIREHIPRENFSTFEQLISASREAEMLTKSVSEVKKTVPSSNRCSFCRNKGHSIDTCIKKKKRDELQNSQQVTQQNQNILDNHPQRSQPELLKKPTFSCYGCGAPGVYRSNCTTCNGGRKDSPHYLGFNSLTSTVSGHSLPTTCVEFFGLKGEAVFDCGAKTSVTSLEVMEILLANKCTFQDVCAEITLADGSITTGKVMSTTCDVIIGNRLCKIGLIYLPNATINRTLLGADFLEQAGIVLNMAQKYWYFEDQPKQKFSFTNLVETTVCAMQVDEETSS